jgi:anti-sigma regulatory factor (Ser/Thr protein kinase)
VVRFRHEALVHDGDDGFLAGAVPFVREGLEAEEPILVAVGVERIALLRDALGDDAGGVQFADMRQLGRNPGRIIPAWHDFLDAHRGGEPAAVRGIGEPIWPGRGPAELIECQLHESLLNLAFTDADGFRRLCPYDAAALDAEVIHAACGSHPSVVDDGGRRDSAHYRGADELLAPFDAPLPVHRASAETLGFENDGLPEVRRLITGGARAAGLSADATQDLLLATSEIAANSIRHGGGRGVLRVWQDDGALICEIRDPGHIRDPLAGRRKPAPGRPGRWGLWLAHRVCDLVQVRSGADGTIVRMHMRAG